MTNLNLVLIDSLVEMFLLVIVYLKHAAADEGGLVGMIFGPL